MAQVKMSCQGKMMPVLHVKFSLNLLMQWPVLQLLIQPMLKKKACFHHMWTNIVYQSEYLGQLSWSVEQVENKLKNTHWLQVLTAGPSIYTEINEMPHVTKPKSVTQIEVWIFHHYRSSFWTLQIKLSLKLNTGCLQFLFSGFRFDFLVI